PPPSPPLFPYTTLFRSPCPLAALPPPLTKRAAGRRTRRRACFPGGHLRRASVLAHCLRSSATGLRRLHGSRFCCLLGVLDDAARSEEHTSELQSRSDLV